MFRGLVRLPQLVCSYNDKVLFPVTEATGKTELSALRLPNLFKQSSRQETHERLCYINLAYLETLVTIGNVKT